MQLTDDDLTTLRMLMIGSNTPQMSTDTFMKKGKIYNYFYGSVLFFETNLKNYNFDNNYVESIKQLQIFKETLRENSFNIENEAIHNTINLLTHVNSAISEKEDLLKGKDARYIDEWVELFQSHQVDVTDFIKKTTTIYDEFNAYKEQEIKSNNLFLKSSDTIIRLSQQYLRQTPTNDNQENMNLFLTSIEPFIDNILSNNLDTSKLKNCDFYLDKLKQVDKNIKEKYEETILKANKGYTMADSFKLLEDNLSKTSIDFINMKNLKYSIEHHFVISNGKYHEVMVFNDNSVFIKNDKENIAPFNCSEYTPIVKEVYNSYIKDLLSNKPNVAKSFINIISQDETYRIIDEAFPAINTYKEKEHILKSSDFNIVNMLSKNNFKDFEYLDDLMNATVKKHDVKKYAHSIISNKYKNLYNESTYKIFEELFDAGVSKALLDNSIGKKIAAFKDPESFNSALESFLSNFNNFSSDAIKVKAQNVNADIVLSEGNLLILKINDFVQSKYLGSSSWCISRDKHYFDSYTSDKASQYFVYNFNKDSKDNESMIGITIKNNQVSAAHLKDDKRLVDETLKNTLLQKINFATYEQNIERKVSLNKLSV